MLFDHHDSHDSGSSMSHSLISPSEYLRQEQAREVLKVKSSQRKWFRSEYLANFGVQYNFTNVSIALLFLDQGGVWYSEDKWNGNVGSVLKSIVFVGSIFGMCVMGFVGDMLGRNHAFTVTSMIMVAFALGSAFLPNGAEDGGGDAALTVLACCRFGLGFGIGGCYPLSAAKSAEEGGTISVAAKNFDVGMNLFYQGLGIVAPYAVAAGLDASLSDATWKFRLGLAAGALPPFLVMLMVWGTEESEEFRNAAHARRLLNTEFGHGGADGGRSRLRTGMLSRVKTTSSSTTRNVSSGGRGGGGGGGDVYSSDDGGSSDHESGDQRSGGGGGRGNGLRSSVPFTPSAASSAWRTVTKFCTGCFVECACVRGFVRHIKLGFQDPNMCKTLMATAVAWAIHDVGYYGSSQFTPTMTAEVFSAGGGNGDDGDDDNSAQSVASVATEDVVATVVGIPAVLLALWSLGWIGTKRLAVWGFLLIVACCIVLACCWNTLRHATKEQAADDYDGDSKWAANMLFALYVCFTFSVDSGTKVSTFVLPQEVFKVETRTTFNGISAAAGKLGAVVGIWTFEKVYQSFGVVPLMVVIAILNLVGAVICQVCISDDLWKKQVGQQAEQRRIEAAQAMIDAANRRQLQLEREEAADIDHPR